MIFNDIYEEAVQVGELLNDYEKYLILMKNITNTIEENQKKILFSFTPNNSAKDIIFRNCFSVLQGDLKRFAKYGIEFGIDNANLEKQNFEYFDLTYLKEAYGDFFINITQWMIENLAFSENTNNKIYERYLSLIRIIDETDKLRNKADEIINIKKYTYNKRADFNTQETKILSIRYDVDSENVSYIAYNVVSMKYVIEFVNTFKCEEDEEIYVQKLESGSLGWDIAGALGLVNLFKSIFNVYIDFRTKLNAVKMLDETYRHTQFENLNSEILAIAEVSERLGDEKSIEIIKKMNQASLIAMASARGIKFDGESLEFNSHLNIEQLSENLLLQEDLLSITNNEIDETDENKG